MYSYVKGKGWIPSREDIHIVTQGSRSWKVYNRPPKNNEKAIGCTEHSIMANKIRKERGEVDFRSVADYYADAGLTFAVTPHYYDYVFVVEEI